MDKEVELETAEEKGLKKGLEEGIKEGSKNRNIEIAKKMLQKNIEIETIIEITGLTQEEIEKINV